MSQEERFGIRDRSYSAWHRRESTRRFVGIERAQTLGMIDLDASLYVEYDDGSKEPLALVETSIDIGQTFKTATVTRKLAQRCHPTLPAYVLLYTLSDLQNPADTRWKDIIAFRVKRVWPEPDLGSTWKILTPQEWADNLVRLREWSARRLDQIAGFFCLTGGNSDMTDRLCVDCRFAELQADRGDRWICNHPSASFQPPRSLVTGVLREPYQLSCFDARNGRTHMVLCEEEARYWEPRS